MLQRKSPRLSGNQSKRLTRRIKVVFDWIKGSIPSSFPIFLFLLFLFLIYNLFSVKRISCAINSETCPPDVMERLNSEIGSNSLLINQKKLIQNIKTIYPVENAEIGFKMFNTLSVSLTGNKKSYSVDIYLMKDIPPLTMDSAPGSTISSDWPRPTQEISTFINSVDFSSFDIWDNGTMTPIASTSSSVKYIISEKPEKEIISSLYDLIRLSFKYLNPQEIDVLNDRVFLRQVDQPDIIVSIPFNETSLTEAFQSIGYLATIKKDARVIDLRFKNPIIR